MKKPVAILGALREEIAGIRGAMTLGEQARWGKADVWTGTWNGIPVVLMRTGIGGSRAVEGLSRLLDHHAPRLVISIGFAGALQESLKVGDLLLAETLQPSDSPGEIRIDPELMQQALRVPVPDGVSRIPGRLVTVGEPVSLPGKKQELGRRHSAQAVDMETAPLARLAQEQQLPFLSVRAISDTLNQALFDISPLLKPEGEVSPLKAGWFVLTHPGSLKSLVRLRDQAHRARQNLTRFLSSWMATMTP